MKRRRIETLVRTIETRAMISTFVKNCFLFLCEGVCPLVNASVQIQLHLSEVFGGEEGGGGVFGGERWKAFFFVFFWL